MNREQKKGIPKIIHYCWFGQKEKPRDVKRYIATWRKILLDYEIKEWNEENFPLNNAPIYVKEAYNVGKYAFVSDYVRIAVLCEYGGIYFDTDVEVIKNFDQYLKNYSLVLSFESEKLLAAAFIACEKNHPFLEKFKQMYDHRHFINSDGSYDLTTINEYLSVQVKKWGADLNINKEQELSGKIKIYPKEIFCGFDVNYWHVRKTEQTCVIHHMAASWLASGQKWHAKMILLLQRVLGYRCYDWLKDHFDNRRKNR